MARDLSEELEDDTLDDEAGVEIKDWSGLWNYDGPERRSGSRSFQGPDRRAAPQPESQGPR